MNNFDKFLLWEAKSRDTIDFKKVYVDIAGDLVAGLLLSQIIYWYLPDEHGRTKLRVNKNGNLWIAKGRDDWWQEIRITGKQFDRASSILIEKGILIKDHFRFNGLRTIHIRLDYDHFMALWQAQLEPPAIDLSGNPQLPKGETRNYPKVKPAIDLSANPLTESTAKTTTETKSPNGEIAHPSTNGQNKPAKLIEPTPPLTDQEKDELLFFGKHPDSDQVDPAFDVIQEIKAAGWKVRDGAVEFGIAYYIDAMRVKHPGFAIPNNPGVRNDWYKAIKGHLDDYRLDDLKALYEQALAKHIEEGWSYTRPGSLTNTLTTLALKLGQGDVVAWF